MKCNNCGETFDDQEVTHHREPHGEVVPCCPYCGVSDMTETQRCNICGREFADEDTDIAHGYCLECLWNAIDYDTTLAYVKDGNVLADFIVGHVFGAGQLTHSSDAFDRFCEETFKRLVANDKLLGYSGNDPRFLIQCRSYCLPTYAFDFGADGQEFAGWFSKRERG